MPITPPPAPQSNFDADLAVPSQPVAAPQTTSAGGAEGGSSLPGARPYVVQPGDSLWSIAKRLLGADASPARIAGEVNRLWSLNEGRIGTGDPDLLMVGTELRLR